MNIRKRIGGTMPEDLPTPNKSAKLIEKEKNRRLNAQNKKIINNRKIKVKFLYW